MIRLKTIVAVIIMVIVWDVFVEHWVMFLLWGIVVFNIGRRVEDWWNNFEILIDKHTGHWKDS